MKVVSTVELMRIERIAYQEGFSEEEFMNNAGQKVAEVIQHTVARSHQLPKIIFLCGKGNNAGDGYVAATQLLSGGFQVSVYALFPLHESSKLCQLQAKRFEEAGGKIHFIQSAKEIDLKNGTLIIDALLGTGFKGPLTGILHEVISKANLSKISIISIDIPSGVNGTTGECEDAIIAEETCCLGLPKSGFFLGKAYNHIGKLHVLPFGLTEEHISLAKEEFTFLEESQIKELLPGLVRTRHKYEAGYVVGIGGSKGMPGAPLLTSLAALKTGAGIVRLLHPKAMQAEFAGAPLEIIRESYTKTDEVLKALKRAKAIFIGPGMGIEKRTATFLKKVLSSIDSPCVIDAEALTLIAEHDIELPKNAILTPHVGECERLLKVGKEKKGLKLWQLCQEFVEKNRVTLVLKGAPTVIFHPKKAPMICSRGDPGMATAGSGDVLTGMIAAFLAQQKSPLEAAALGVYLHGMAGEMAAAKYTSYCMTATNIIEMLSVTFKKLHGAIPQTL